MDNRKKNFLIALLRRGTYKWPTRWVAEKRTRLGKGYYWCEECGVISKKKGTQMDHVIPVVDPEKGYTTLDEYADRMYPDTEFGWRRLCLSCHQTKSAIENSVRKESKKKLDK